MRRFVVPAMDVGQRRGKVEPGHRLGMAAVHVSGCAVVVDAFADADGDPAVWPEASPADSRHRIRLLVCGLLIFLAGSEKHSAELLNRHPQLALEHHRVWQVPPVEPHEFDRRLTIPRCCGWAEHQGCACEGGRVCTHAPGSADVVLQACPADCRQFLIAVPVDLDLALPVPVTRVDDPHAYVAADKPAGSGEIFDNGKIASLDGRVFATERGVQIAAFGFGSAMKCVVDLGSTARPRAPTR